MDRKYHVAGFVCEYCILLGCGVVKELEAFLHGCVCWGGLFSDARVLRGVGIVPSTAHAENKNIPVTAWMNFFPDLSNNCVSLIGFANCSFAPYVFLTLRCGWPCWIRGGGCWKHLRAFWTYVGIERCTLHLS
jgi:hypothetical protein